jgi:hypothetical protein
MSIVARDDGGNIVDAYTPSTTQVFTVGTTSAASTNAFGTNTTLVRVACSNGHCHIAFGSGTPVASITTSMMIPTNTVSIFKVTAGHKMAYIKDAGVTLSTVSVTELL